MAPETLALKVTITPGSEEYKRPKLLDRIARDPAVVDVEEVDDVSD